MEREIYKMDMHEVLTPASELSMQIVKVPGGWIYRFFEISQHKGPSGTWSENYIVDSVFVPHKP